MDKDNVTMALDKIFDECGTDEKKWLKRLEKGAVNLDYSFTVQSGESYKVKAKWQCVDVQVELVSVDGENVVIH